MIELKQGPSVGASLADKGLPKGGMVETISRLRGEETYAARLRHDLLGVCGNMCFAASMASEGKGGEAQKKSKELFAECDKLAESMQENFETSGNERLLALAGLLLEFKQKYLDFAVDYGPVEGREKALWRAGRLDPFIAELKGERDREHVFIDLAGRLIELMGMQNGKLWIDIPEEEKFWVNVSAFGLDRSLDNLVANALQAAKKTGVEKANIELACEGDFAVMKVRNRADLNNGLINLVNSGEIFKQGVSSKGEEGHGYGLLTVAVFARKNDATVSSRVVGGDIVEIEVRIPICEPPRESGL